MKGGFPREAPERSRSGVSDTIDNQSRTNLRPLWANFAVRRMALERQQSPRTYRSSVDPSRSFRHQFFAPKFGPSAFPFQTHKTENLGRACLDELADLVVARDVKGE